MMIDHGVSAEGASQKTTKEVGSSSVLHFPFSNSIKQGICGIEIFLGDQRLMGTLGDDEAVFVKDSVGG